MTARDDLDQLKATLADHGDDLMVELFGEPTTKTARFWRWGRKGSLSYRRQRGGAFYSFEESRGGSLLDAIMFRQGCNLTGAVEYARRFLGDDDTRPRPKPRPTPTPIDADDEEARAAAEAVELWRTGRRIEGTAAARYLQGRAITGWPDDVVRLVSARDVARIVTKVDDNGRRKRWDWWRWPALVLPLTDRSGTVRSVQLIALTDQGEAVPHWDHGGKIKQMRGPRHGCAVRLPGDDTGPLVLAEGGETALSIWLATGFDTLAALGAIGQAPLDGIDKARTIVVARDDDPHTSQARKGLRDAIRQWRREGRRVVEATPWPLSRGDKSDFNDVLKAHGPDAVRDRIEAALRPSDPPQGRQRSAARLELAQVIGRTMAELQTHQPDDGPAPFKVVRATLGLGKSEATLQAVIDAAGQGHRIAYSVPTHALASDLARRIEAMAEKRGRQITVRVWHGREADNPDAPGETMCTDLQPVEMAQQAGVDVLETVCANCQHKAACAYLTQRGQTADLWLVPHALLFADMPRTMTDVSVLVIDEGFALAGMIGTDGPAVLVPVEGLADTVTAGSGKPSDTADLNATLASIHRQLADAIAEHPASDQGEPLQRAPLVAAGLTVELANAARTAHGKRKRRVDALSAATRPQLMKKLRQLQRVNRDASRSASLWGHIADLLADTGAEAAGRVELVEHDGVRSFRLYGLKRLGKGWREKPTLHLDATADLDLLRLRVPGADLVANVEAAEPHVQVHQVVGKTFGKGALEHTSAADDVRRYTVAMAAEQGGRWLMVGSKGAAEGWRATVPAYVEVAHWGAVRGLDTYGDVAGIVIAGRWGVGPNDVGRMAAILTGRAVPRVSGWYPAEAVTLTAADGTIRSVDADRHPDQVAEKVRRALVEAELLQAIGRGRGVQRTADNPLAVYVLGNVPLPLPLASLSDWQPVDFDRAMMADHGAVLSSQSDAAAVLGMTPAAVKKARQRQGGQRGTGPYKDYLYGHVPIWSGGLATATYQRAGERWAEQRMVYDPRRIPDPRAWLVARFGPLAHFDADDGPEAPPPAASRPVVEKIAPMPDLAAEPLVADLSVKNTKPPTDPHDLAGSQGPALVQQQGYEPAVLPAGVSVQLDGPGGFLAVGLDQPVNNGLLAGDLSEKTDSAPERLGDPLSDYALAGGTIPGDLAGLIRVRQHDAGITQQGLADRIGISRPQLANALQGRFGLSAAAAARLRDALASLPASQGRLL